MHAHVGNCVKAAELAGYGDRHPRFGFPGGENGVPELVDFLQALFAVGYLKKTPDGSKPWVGIEVKPMPGETSEAVLAARSGPGSRPGHARGGLSTGQAGRWTYHKVCRRRHQTSDRAGDHARSEDRVRSGDLHVARPPEVKPLTTVSAT